MIDDVTPTTFALPFVCAKGHDPREVAVRVHTIVRLSSGKETRVTRDFPPGRAVGPLASVPAEMQRPMYEMKCPSCRTRYSLTPGRASAAVEAARQMELKSVDVQKSVDGGLALS